MKKYEDLRSIVKTKLQLFFPVNIAWHENGLEEYEMQKSKLENILN